MHGAQQYSVLLVISTAFACAEAPPGAGKPRAKNEIFGVVAAPGPVVGAQVTVSKRIDAPVHVTGSTDSNGQFHLDVLPLSGPLWLCAHGGTFLDPDTAIADTITAPWCTIVDVAVNKSVGPVVLTPWSLWAEALAFSPAGGATDQSDNAVIGQALRGAEQKLDAFFGCGTGSSVLTVLPLDPTSAPEVPVTMSAAVLSGYGLAAISAQARLICLVQNKTPGVCLNVQSLSREYARDLRFDSIQDGKGADGQIKIADGYELGLWSLRGGEHGYPHAYRTFLVSERNKGGLSFEDVRDVLECMAQSEDEQGLFMKGTEGGGLDTERPQVNIVLPAQGQVLGGNVSFECHGFDSNEIDSLRLWARRENASQDLPTTVWIDRRESYDKQNGHLWATFVSTLTEDGKVELGCEARDKYDQTASERVIITVNNKLGIVTIVQPQDRSTVEGDAVPVECHCEDEQDNLCEFVRPSPEGGALRLLPSDNPRHVLGLWNTTLEPEGTYVLECQASSPAAPMPQSGNASVVIDNIDLGQICGTVFADTPVRGARVSAFAYEQAVRGALLGQTTTPTESAGSFCLDMPDNYSGPVVLEARAMGATYTSGVDKKTVEFGTHSLTLVLDSYTPGQKIDGVSINYQTKLAECFTRAWTRLRPEWLEDPSFAGASQAAHYWVGRHPRQPGQEPINIRFTPVRDFVNNSEVNTSQDSTELGLETMSLSRLGAAIALAETGNLNSISTILPGIAVAERLCLDALSGVLDQRSEDGSTLYWTTNTNAHTPISLEAYRWEQASHLVNWLDNTLLNPALVAMNQSGLTSSAFNFPGGLIQNIATDRSPMFPAGDPKPWDAAGPKLTVEVRDATNSVISCSAAGSAPVLRQEIMVNVLAEDPSNIMHLEASLVDGDNTAVRRGILAAPGQVQQFYVDTRRLVDRREPYAIRVYARDGAGNSSEEFCRFVVDNTPPTLAGVRLNPPEGAQPGWVRSLEAEISGEVNDANSVSVLTFAINGEQSVSIERPNSGAFRHVVMLPACNLKHSLSVSAVDQAGNTVAQPAIVNVECDNRAPSHVLANSKVNSLERSNLHFSYDDSCNLTCVRSAATEDNGVTEQIELSSAPWPLTLEKAFHLLDAPTLASGGCAAREPEYFKFRVSDNPGQATAETSYTRNVEQLTVEYRYLFNGEERRAWMRPNVIAGDFAVPLTYQALLPVSPSQTADSNFIARSKNSDRHTIEVRIKDLAGNTAVTGDRYTFFLRLFAPPACLSQCGLTTDITEKSLEQGTLHEIYAQGTRRVGSARLAWKLPLPPGSLVPRDPLALTISGAEVSSRIGEIRSEKVSVAEKYFIPETPAIYSCFLDARNDVSKRSKHQIKNLASGQFAGCLDSFRWDPNGVVVSGGFTVNHERRLLVGDRELGPTGTADVAPNATLALGVNVYSPTVVVNGRSLAWRTYASDGGIRYEQSVSEEGRDISLIVRYQQIQYEAADWRIVEYPSQWSFGLAPILVRANHPILPTRRVDGSFIERPNVDVHFKNTCAEQQQVFRKSWSLP